MSHKENENPMDDAPRWLMWTMTFINRIGFPIAVTIYLGYVQLNALPKVVEALTIVNSTMGRVEVAIKQNSELIRIWQNRDDRRR